MAKVSVDDCRTIEEFRALTTEKRKYFAETCKVWSKKLTKLDADGLSEDIVGMLRLAIGQATILTDKKGRMTQFENLIDSCVNKVGQHPTKFSDLQGFWDLIEYQSKQIVAKFEELVALEAKDWKIDEELPVENVRSAEKVKKVTNKTLTKAKSSSQLRELMSNMRKVMAEEKEESIATDAPKIEVSAEKDDRVFDGGFFKISSPLRCDAKSPRTDKSGDRRLSDVMRRTVLQPTSPFAVVKISQQIRMNLKGNNEFDTKKELFCDADENVAPPAKAAKVE